jgi:hydroxymethylbilane synthase
MCMMVIITKKRSEKKKTNQTIGGGYESYGEGESFKLKCGTRKSALAMVQTRWVCSTLTHINPSITIQVLDGVDTMADKTLNVSLKELVQKEVNNPVDKKPSPGLFTKELEEGLLANRYDFVVHSLKDVPTTLPEGLVIAAICEREDPRDCVVFRDSNISDLNDLKPGSILGTSSVRREAILRRDYPSFQIKLIRGNVNTRLAKLEAGEYDAIILAYAGMKRLGFKARVGQVLDPKKFPYGVSQGSLGIQCRAKDEQFRRIIALIGHEDSTFRCLCERALLRELEGGCQVPLGVTTRVYFSTAKAQKWLEVSCQIMSLNGKCTVSGELDGPASDCESIGVKLAQRLREQAGGMHLIRADDTWSTHQNISKPTNKRPITYGSAEEPSRS